jgi:uncharacterized protein YndB with AHSA1/START domain
MASRLDISVDTVIDAPPERVRQIMFDPKQDPSWMAAVKQVEMLSEYGRPGARVRRTGQFMGRTLRWTTEVKRIDDHAVELEIIDGPMRGTVFYSVEPAGDGSRVTIRNIGDAPGFAPRALLSWAMRRSLTATCSG